MRRDQPERAQIGDCATGSPWTSSPAAVRSTFSDLSACGCRAIPRGSADGGFPVWRSTGLSVPPVSAPHGPGEFPSACGSASHAGSEPDNRARAGSIARSAVRLSCPLTGGPFRVGRRDQAKLRVEDVDQVVEVPGAVRVTRCFEQFLTRSHLPLDVGAALGQQRFQHRLGGFLVEAMFGVSLG